MSRAGKAKTASPWGTYDQGGYFPGDTGLERLYSWLGFRIGAVGNVG